MDELYELREKLCNELKGYAHKDMSSGSLDVVDKLAHSIKNLDRVIENSGNDRSYARRRDSMGRYSSNGYSYHNLHEMMEDEPDERKRQEYRRFIQRLESM